MKKKRYFVISLLIILSIFTTGCGENQIPEMTEEELNQVGEYAAFALLKYDASKRSRLVEIPEELPEETIPVEEEDEDNENNHQGMNPVDDTPVIDLEGNRVGNGGSIEETLELSEGTQIVYSGVTICDKYPEEGTESYFAITPSEGNHILAVRFKLQNNTDEDKEVDVLSTNAYFKLVLNGDYSRRALTTMLPNDLSTYRETLTAGSETEVVLLIETSLQEDSEINSLELILKNESNVCTIKLI